MKIFLNFKSKKGFTLIELLVVIAIIGVLSGVVSAFLNGARDKGRIAAGMQFEANTYHSIGDQMIGEWKLDKDPGSSPKIAIDTSGFGNNGTVGSTVSWVPNGGYNGLGTYKFVGASGQQSGVFLPTNSPILNIGRAGSDFTISAWVKYTSNSNAGSGNYATVFWEEDNNGAQPGHVVQFTIASNKLVLNFYGQNNSGSNKISYNKWTQVAVTFKSATKQASFYVDGTLDSTITADISPNFNPTLRCARIGIRYCGEYNPGSDFDGMMNNVRVYSSAITAMEMQKLYAEGLKDHQDLALIK
jgi:prepilin-type N-terminal cleavage/methylation domain-containing protein